MFLRYLTCTFLGLCLFFPELYAQEEEPARQNQTIPNVLRRPERSEAPRFPQDIVIGELGKGESSVEAWLFAQNLLSALVAGSTDAPVMASSSRVLTESLREEINSLEPRAYRLGGGKIETDGCVSYLVRFLGPEESITGELFIRQEEKTDSAEARWLLDELVLEEKKSLADIRDSYRYDFSPYERLY